jgi:hypothetical protein
VPFKSLHVEAVHCFAEAHYSPFAGHFPSHEDDVGTLEGGEDGNWGAAGRALGCVGGDGEGLDIDALLFEICEAE